MCDLEHKLFTNENNLSKYNLQHLAAAGSSTDHVEKKWQGPPVMGCQTDAKCHGYQPLLFKTTPTYKIMEAPFKFIKGAPICKMGAPT